MMKSALPLLSCAIVVFVLAGADSRPAEDVVVFQDGFERADRFSEVPGALSGRWYVNWPWQKPHIIKGRGREGTNAIVIGDEPELYILPILMPLREGRITCWLKDSSDRSANQACFVYVTDEAPHASRAALGIYKNADHYSCLLGSYYTWKPTLAKRSEGWHKLEFVLLPERGCLLLIDGEQIGRVETLKQINALWFGNRWSLGSPRRDGIQPQGQRFLLDDFSITIPRTCKYMSISILPVREEEYYEPGKPLKMKVGLKPFNGIQFEGNVSCVITDIFGKTVQNTDLRIASVPYSQTVSFTPPKNGYYLFRFSMFDRGAKKNFTHYLEVWVK